MQRIFVNGSVLNRFALECGVKRGSCLGPLFFTIYTNKLFEILPLHLPSAHAYADDIQLYVSFILSDSLNKLEDVTTLENCILDVCAWVRGDMLWLNDEKTEFLLVSSRQQLAKVSINGIEVG